MKTIEMLAANNSFANMSTVWMIIGGIIFAIACRKLYVCSPYGEDTDAMMFVITTAINFCHKFDVTLSDAKRKKAIKAMNILQKHSNVRAELGVITRGKPKSRDWRKLERRIFKASSAISRAEKLIPGRITVITTTTS